MNKTREHYAQEAINYFVGYSCVFLLPGPENSRVNEVGSGILIRSKKDEIYIVTAKHVAKDAEDKEFRLGFYNCSNLIPNFVENIKVGPRDCDVSILVVKKSLSKQLIPLAVDYNLIPSRKYFIKDDDHLILLGYPSTYYSRVNNEQGFFLNTYWYPSNKVEVDSRDRYNLKWDKANTWIEDKEFDLPHPGGMSGGPLWCFSKPKNDDYTWTAKKAAHLIGIQSAWLASEHIVIIESINKWYDWFHEFNNKI